MQHFQGIVCDSITEMEPSHYTTVDLSTTRTVRIEAKTLSPYPSIIQSLLIICVPEFIATQISLTRPDKKVIGLRFIRNYQNVDHDILGSGKIHFVIYGSCRMPYKGISVVYILEDPSEYLHTAVSLIYS